MLGERRLFADSNIVLYALGDDSSKRQAAWQILFERPVISVQVLNECSNILVKKRKVDKAKVGGIMQDILCFTTVEAIGFPEVEAAWRLMERYRYSYFDSLILASALRAGCQTVYSEDMQHGQTIEGKVIVTNPFLPWPKQ